MKILSGIVCFALAALAFLLLGLVGLAWVAQFSNRAATAPAAATSIMIGSWTLSGWQIYAVVSVLLTLTLAFVLCGVSVMKSSKKED